MKEENPNRSIVMAKVKGFWKVGQSPRSRSKGQSSWYPMKGLLTRITHMKNESHIPYSLKVMAKVKVFVTDGQTDRHKDEWDFAKVGDNTNRR